MRKRCDLSRPIFNDQYYLPMPFVDSGEFVNPDSFDVDLDFTISDDGKNTIEAWCKVHEGVLNIVLSSESCTVADVIFNESEIRVKFSDDNTLVIKPKSKSFEVVKASKKKNGSLKLAINL